MTLSLCIVASDMLLKGDACQENKGVLSSKGLPRWLSWSRICPQCGRPGFDPWVGKIPWRREWLPTPVFWPGEFHGLYRPCGRKESDPTERPSLVIKDSTYTVTSISCNHSSLPNPHQAPQTPVLFCLGLPWVLCLVTQPCPSLCDHMDCIPLGSCVHGILQARTLEWVAVPFSRGSSQPRDQTQVSCLAGGFFTV